MGENTLPLCISSKVDWKDKSRKTLVKRSNKKRLMNTKSVTQDYLIDRRQVKIKIRINSTMKNFIKIFIFQIIYGALAFLGCMILNVFF